MSAALPTDSAARSHRLLARLALAAGLLTLIVIAASAFIRHTQAGLGCAGWPACYAQVDRHADAEVPSTSVTFARLGHRLAASGALAVIIGLWLIARARGPAFSRERNLGFAALLVAAALALLGIATPGANLPAVPVGNLLGGYLMVAAMAAVAGASTSADSVATQTRMANAAVRPIALGLLAVALVQAGLGALIGTQFALTACTELVRCPGFALSELAAGIAPSTFRPVVIVDGHAVAPAGAATLHVIHRLLGLGLTAGALGLTYVLRVTDPRSARFLAMLALAAPLLGATAVVAMPSLAVTVLHNAAAASLIGGLAYVAAPRTVGGGRNSI